MAVLTKARAQALLEKYYQALENIADGKSFTMASESGTRQLTENSIPEIKDEITRLQRIVTNTSGMTHNIALVNFNRSR